MPKVRREKTKTKTSRNSKAAREPLWRKREKNDLKTVNKTTIKTLPKRLWWSPLMKDTGVVIWPTFIYTEIRWLSMRYKWVFREIVAAFVCAVQFEVELENDILKTISSFDDVCDQRSRMQTRTQLRSLFNASTATILLDQCHKCRPHWHLCLWP